MKPSIGRIVTLHLNDRNKELSFLLDKVTGERACDADVPDGAFRAVTLPAIVTLVDGDERLNCTAFFPNGTTCGFNRVRKLGEEGDSGFAWDWPERVQ